MIILLVLFILIVAYLWMIMPNLSRKDKMKSFENVYIAHRGFFNNVDIPENSLSAFKKAVENNYGIELDVQMTKDDKLVVFHDESLKRICGIDKKLTDCNLDELLNYNLLNTNKKIPLLKDVLDVLNKDTPLIVEIKPEGECIKTCEKAIELLKTYDRNYTMESFNPLVVGYLRKYHKEIIRGQLAYNMLKDKEEKSNVLRKFNCTYLLENFLTRPDYIAYDINNMNNLSFRIISKLYKGECVAWTIKNKEQLKESRKYYQQFIFDSFTPTKKDN